MGVSFMAAISALGLFCGMVLFTEAGRRLGSARIARDPEGVVTGAGAVEGAVLGLLGLLLAFTFSGAASRFEARRHLITQETNAIGTAYLRLGLLPVGVQPEMRELFRRYLDQRADIYRNPEDVPATSVKQMKVAAMQAEIWAKALSACRQPDAPASAAMLLLPALNEMFDITTTRAVATENHPPLIVYLMLASLGCISALLAGYAMSCTKARSWLYTVVLAATISLTLYVILDLEFPRLGLIRIDTADHTLIELRRSMQ